MEKICQHIEKLLAQHDYVVMPELGGFVVQMQSAQIAGGCIKPPLATIGFNPLMHHADGLLAIEIARAEGISYRLSMEYIEKEVSKIKAKLVADRSVQIGNLGVLQMTDADNFYFQPNERAEFLPQNFQLSELYILPRSSKEATDPKQISFTLPSKRIYQYAAAGILFFGLFFISPKLNDAARPDQADFLSLIPAITEKVQTAEAKMPEIEADSVSVLPVKTTIDTQYYHVVVASLSTAETAQTYCDGLKDDDYTGAHVLVGKHISRVVLQSFTDKDKAIEYMENLRKTDHRFTTAWVLCK